MSHWASRQYFSASEFDHPDEMDAEFIARLDRARGLAGIPFIITSDYRPGDQRAHGLGKAVDIRCKSSSDRFCILNALLSAGFCRVGVYLHEDGGGGHLHADTATAEEGFPQDVVWTGRSK